MKDAEAVTFAGGRLDRGTALRGDAAQAGLLADPRALCLPLWDGRPLIGVPDAGGVARLGWLPMASPVFKGAAEPAIFLGVDAAGPRYARVVPDWAPRAEAAGPPPFLDDGRVAHPALAGDLAFADLRATMAALDPGDAGIAATAKGILGWHGTHGFCAACGAPSALADAGWRRACPACGAQHFPRTDPVVIMLIVEGNALLLGRSPGWPPAMYSLLAGFMEPGESIEAAVRREVFEETAVAVGEVGYLASQPWPFPSSLMIGCRGEAKGREIRLDPAELEDARWVSREGVMAALAGQDPAIRPARPGSIARFLIERWLADRLD